MTLKASYEKQSDIPEALKSEYVEKDGEWVLDAEGMVVSSELTSIKTRLDEFRQNNIDLQGKLKKFEGKKILSPEEQEEFDRLILQETEIRDKKLVEAGKIDELLEARTGKMKTDFEAQIKSLKDSLGESQTVGKETGRRLSKVLIRSEVSQFLSDNGINPVKGAMEDIFARAGSTWQADDKGKLQPVNESGETVYGSKGEALTLKEWGDQLVKDAPYLFAKSEGSGGKGGKKPGATDADGIIKIPRSDEEMKGRHIKEIAEGKAIVVDG